MTRSIGDALRRNGFKVVDDAALVMRLKVDAARDTVRHAVWQIRILGPEGRELARDDYSSTLGATPSQQSLVAFSEAAAVAEIGILRSSLGPLADRLAQR